MPHGTFLAASPALGIYATNLLRDEIRSESGLSFGRMPRADGLSLSGT